MEFLNPKVTIAVPSGFMVHADFMMSLAGVLTSAPLPLHNKGRIERLNLYNTKGSILPKSRTQLVKLAQKAESTHILFIDSDQTFPEWTLHQLLKHGRQCVAANIATKTIPANPTARIWNPEKPAGDLVYTTPVSPELERVWRVGTGIMLIEMSVFDKVPEPWFPMDWSPLMQDYVGEDWNFCEKLTDAGVPIFVDHKLSRYIGHLGQLEYTHEFVGETEQENVKG